MKDKDFKILMEAYNTIIEGVEEQSRVAELLKNSIKGHMPEFVSFEYKNKQGEHARYTLNVGIPYSRIQEKSLEKLNQFESGVPDDLKEKITGVLESKMNKGTLNLKKYGGSLELNPDTIDSLIKEALSQLETSISVSMSKAGQLDAEQKESDALYDSISKGVKVHKTTGELYLWGLVSGKKNLGMAGEYKESKSDPVVVIKNIISSVLPKYREFKLEPSLIGNARVSGNTLDLEP